MTARQTDKHPMGGHEAGGQPYEHWEPYDANAALRNQITRTRADLGETLSELAARADVKARARQAVSQARDRTRDALQKGARSAMARTSSVARATLARTSGVARTTLARTSGVARTTLARTSGVARTTAARTSSVTHAGASSGRRLLDQMGQRPVAVVVCGAAGTLVGFGVYALLRRRLPFSSAWPMARARLAQARRARARMERELMEQAHRKRVDRERAHRERAYRTQGRRR